METKQSASILFHEILIQRAMTNTLNAIMRKIDMRLVIDHRLENPSPINRPKHIAPMP
jgi:hypothetical protein